MTTYFHRLNFIFLAAVFLFVAIIQSVYLIHSIGNNDRTHVSFQSDAAKACRITEYSTLEKDIMTYFKTGNKQQMSVPIIAFTAERISVVINTPIIDKNAIDFLRLTLAESLVELENPKKPCYDAAQITSIKTDDQHAKLPYINHVTVHDGVGVIGWLSMLFNITIAVFLYRIRPSHGHAA